MSIMCYSAPQQLWCSFNYVAVYIIICMGDCGYKWIQLFVYNNVHYDWSVISLSNYPLVTASSLKSISVTVGGVLCEGALTMSLLDGARFRGPLTDVIALNVSLLMASIFWHTT